MKIIDREYKTRVIEALKYRDLSDESWNEVANAMLKACNNYNTDTFDEEVFGDTIDEIDTD